MCLNLFRLYFIFSLTLSWISLSLKQNIKKHLKLIKVTFDNIMLTFYYYKNLIYQ